MTTRKEEARGYKAKILKFNVLKFLMGHSEIIKNRGGGDVF